MNTAIYVIVSFAGAIFAAPQKPSQYQQTAYNVNYPYRPQPPTYQIVNKPSTSQLAGEPNRRQIQRTKPRFRTIMPPVHTTEASVIDVGLPQIQTTIPRKPYLVILRQNQETNIDGSFTYSFETENGISEDVVGYLKNPGTETEVQVMTGTYSYTAPDGTPITTSWFADETGFHAVGAHLPTPPSPSGSPNYSTNYQRSIPENEEKAEHN